MTAAGAARYSELQIWLADLEALAPAMEACEQRYGLLAQSERNWPTQSPPDTRRLRRLARIALRTVLARAGSSPAHGAEFAADANGKPALPGSELAFNASHAGDHALYIVSALGPVGIDLEGERNVALSERRRAMIEVAAASLARGKSVSTFLQAWTCLEAFAKARGTGIGVLLGELGITASGARDLADVDVAARAAGIISASDLELVPLHMPANFYAAVAAPRPIAPVDLVVHSLEAAHFDLAMSGITAA